MPFSVLSENNQYIHCFLSFLKAETLILPFPSDLTVDALDKALYCVKVGGRNRYYFYQEPCLSISASESPISPGQMIRAFFDESQIEAGAIAIKGLVIDDDESVRVLLSKALVSYSHTVEVTTDGQTEFNLATTYSYDLIISNVSLPKLDGSRIFLQKLV